MLSRIVVPDKRPSGARARQIKRWLSDTHNFCTLISSVAPGTGLITAQLRAFVRWTEEILRLQSLLARDYSSEVFFYASEYRDAKRDMCRGSKVVSGQGRKDERTKIDVNDGRWMDGWVDG
jgi:hypothetical protein